MAKKDTEKQIDFNSELRRLKENGPQRLYLLWGQEDYLREHYFQQLKKLCVPDDEDSFSVKKFSGPELDAAELRSAVDAIPFMSERSLVELRDVDINKLAEPDKYIKVLSDIPNYCTVVFIQGPAYEPDGRLKLIKTLRTQGLELKFEASSKSDLKQWITRRFAAAGKSIDDAATERLIFISGEFMNTLIHEIEKVAAYTKGDTVTTEDVEAVANHIPEAVVFSITELISQKKYDQASAKLSELLSTRKNEPIANLAMLGLQMRRLYGARLAYENKLGIKYVMQNCGMKYENHAVSLLNAAKGYTLPQLQRAVELCTETDYLMKSGSVDDDELFKEVFMRIALGEVHD